MSELGEQKIQKLLEHSSGRELSPMLVSQSEVLSDDLMSQDDIADTSELPIQAQLQNDSSSNPLSIACAEEVLENGRGSDVPRAP